MKQTGGWGGGCRCVIAVIPAMAQDKRNYPHTEGPGAVHLASSAEWNYLPAALSPVPRSFPPSLAPHIHRKVLQRSTKLADAV